jgi:hypothetical protein
MQSLNLRAILIKQNKIKVVSFRRKFVNRDWTFIIYFHQLFGEKFYTNNFIL